MSCIEFEAAIRVSAIIMLPLSIMNFCLRFNAQQKQVMLERGRDFPDLQKHGRFIVGVAKVLEVSTTYLIGHPVKFLVFAGLYFLSTLFLPELVCG